MNIQAIKSFANDLAYIWIGFCGGWIWFGTNVNFWYVFLLDILGVVFIWGVALIVATLFGDKNKTNKDDTKGKK